MEDILEKLSSHSRRALQKAVDFAFSTGGEQVKLEHLLFGLLEEKGSISSELLIKSRLTAAFLKKIMGKRPAKVSHGRLEEMIFSSGLKQVIKKAFLISHLYQHQYVGTEHLLATLIKIPDASLAKVFSSCKINLAELESRLLSVLKSTSKFPDLTDTFAGLKEQAMAEAATGASSALDYFATDLTHPDYQKKIDPVFCREQEIDRLIQVLLRRTKNNPVLLGEPGVGKTAIIEGLAKKIHDKQVPDHLLGKKIISLDLSAVVSGSIYRGEFEGRLKQIIEDVTDDPDTILFIDEIHSIVGAGAAMGSLDAANILKPALARGEVRCIGATTYEDYRKSIEKDAALARRFQPITVKEPSQEQTVEILLGVKNNYEQFHRVKISNQAITAAVKLAGRYLTSRFFPDKALDLIDEAAAQIKLSQGVSVIEKKYRQFKKDMESLRQTKRQAILDEKFAEAIELKNKEKFITSELAEVEKKLARRDLNFTDQITEKEISQVVSKITGIPLSELIQEERQKLIQLESLLAQRVIGQAEAIKAVANCVRRGRLGLNNSHKPIGSFIFLGPSGVGKTEMAKAIAQVVFEDPKALIRLDMSEYSEKFNVSKLIGAPAGYVGHEEAGLLTEAVRRRPYAVILFDEFEKAHPEVFNLLLQILDEGSITDASGRQVNFKNAIVILTSNLGTENLVGQNKIGFFKEGSPAGGLTPILEDWQSVKEQTLKNLRQAVRPELLNRFDKIVLFEPLTGPQIDQIFELKIKELEARLKDRAFKLDVTPDARQFVIEFESDPGLGARLISRNITNLIETPLADLLLEKELPPGKTLKVSVKDKKIVLE